MSLKFDSTHSGHNRVKEKSNYIYINYMHVFIMSTFLLVLYSKPLISPVD